MGNRQTSKRFKKTTKKFECFRCLYIPKHRKSSNIGELLKFPHQFIFAKNLYKLNDILCKLFMQKAKNKFFPPIVSFYHVLQTGR